MPITPADIEALTFSEAKRGYDPKEVDAFLEELSGEVDAMLKKIADLKARLTASDEALEEARKEVGELDAKLGEANLDASADADVVLATERQISQALIVAQQSADNIVKDAKQNADRIRNEADQKAREVIRQALEEKQTELDEIDRLKASREEFRNEYKSLLQHFLDDVEVVFPAGKEPVIPANSHQTDHTTQNPESNPASSAPAPRQADLEGTVLMQETELDLDDLD